MKDEPAFTKNLQTVTAKIFAAGDMDEILRETSQDICAIFAADRLTIYLVNEDKTLIVSKVKTGLDSYEDLKLPFSLEYSIAGYVALNKRLVNIKDVYDIEELNTYDPPVYFLKDVDKSTGYKTKQMLAAPIFSSVDSDEVTGVVQIINSKSGEPFPPAAEDGIVRLCKALTTAFQQGRAKYVSPKTKYDYLVINGVIAAAELDLAMRLARRKNANLEQILTEEFQVSDSALGMCLSKFFGLPYEPFRPERVKPAALLRKLKRQFVENQAWVPIDEDEDAMVVITTDPEHVISSHIVKQVFPKKKVVYRVCANREFTATVEHFYGEEGAPASVDTIINRMERDTASEGASDVDEKIMPDSATVQLVNKIVMEAHKMRASDIHVEPRQGRGKTKIRFRIDGAMMDYTDVPASYHSKIVARLKIMADLDISNRREPQDGKIKFKKFLPSLDVELRIATIPTAGGKEDVVIRILASGKPVPIDDLGLSPYNLQALKSIIIKPYGLFLVCGPTGSGKTTTLHSVLGYINTPETKIWTAEDPVEITDDSLRQVQINPRADLTFARAMRAFLRADPDVIMVGEMRDQETTAIGIEASLTGHRVLATLHTNSAPESIVRLLDMGMDPFNFADALLGIMAQRLARRLCAKCKKPYVATPDEVKLMLSEYIEELKNSDKFQTDPKASYEAIYADWTKNYAYEKGQFILYESVGCDACRNTGYNGRIALHELLRGTDAIKKNIQEHARMWTILTTAVNDGMRTLKQDGIKKVLEGHTNMHAVRAVCIK
jgi:type II secretory ATPase GspE/PulE/Tfp pilus assembly ATPase PilB-like protein